MTASRRRDSASGSVGGGLGPEVGAPEPPEEAEEGRRLVSESRRRCRAAYKSDNVGSCDVGVPLMSAMSAITYYINRFI